MTDRTPKAITPGSDEHLTIIGAPWHLNMLTGKDRADMLAFGRACMDAEAARLRAGADDMGGALNSAGWAIVDAYRKHTRERAPIIFFNFAKPIFRDALIHYLSEMGKDRRTPPAGDAPTTTTKE